MQQLSDGLFGWTEQHAVQPWSQFKVKQHMHSWLLASCHFVVTVVH